MSTPSSSSSQSDPGTEQSSAAGDDALREQVERVLAKIRPSVQDDDGDVELVQITPEGVVQIRFQGACVTCPSSSMTLKMGIEKNLVGKVPGVTSVIAVA